MAVGRRQDRWTCGQADDLTSRKVSLTPLWSGSPEAPRISRGATHSRAHRLVEAGPGSDPTPGSPKPRPPARAGRLRRRQALLLPRGRGPWTLCALLAVSPPLPLGLQRRGDPGCRGALRPSPYAATLTFSAGGCAASPPRGCSGPRDPPPKGGSGVADAAEHRSHSHWLPELARRRSPSSSGRPRCVLSLSQR